MRKIVNVIEVEDGLSTLLGEKLFVMSGNYHYTGTLIGVNDTYIKLENPAIVYETGEWSAKKYKDSQPLGVQFHYLMISHIEGFHVTTKA